MENFLLDVMEFLITLTVITAGISLVVVGISIGFLYGTGMYKNKRAAIITPILLAILVGATGPEDHTSLRQWAYFILPTMALTPLFVSSLCHRKRLKDKGYQSTIS